MHQQKYHCWKQVESQDEPDRCLEVPPYLMAYAPIPFVSTYRDNMSPEAQTDIGMALAEQLASV